MLNIGLIGNTEILEPFVKRIQQNKNVHVIGKASVGMRDELNGFHFSIPEFNRIELIERADVLLIDNSSVLPFNLLCEVVKKSKHLFFAEYLDLTIDECTQLMNLSNESGSIIQVSNPYLFTPAIKWMGEHVSTPIFLDILDFSVGEKETVSLYPKILMLLGITGISPKKVGAVTFKSAPNEANFTNVRLEFGDASVVNLSYGTMKSLEDFKMRSYSKDQFVTFNFTKKTFVCNNEAIDFSEIKVVKEFDWFIGTINKVYKKTSCIQDYLIAKHLVQKIDKKLTQFFTE